MGMSTARDKSSDATVDGSPRRPVFIDDEECVQAFVELVNEIVPPDADQAQWIDRAGEEE